MGVFTPAVTIVDAREAVLALLADRAPAATVCPSEVAKALAVTTGAGEAVDWRTMMPAVHAAVDELAINRRVQLSWKGEALTMRSGPYRIGQPAALR